MVHIGSNGEVLFEQMRGKLVQAAPPGLPLVRGLGGDVEAGVDASGFQLVQTRLGCRAVFASAIGDEHQFVILLELFHVGDVRRGNAAATEDTDIGEGVHVLGGDGACLHATHRKPSHRAVFLIGLGAIVGVNVGDQVVDEQVLKRAEIHAGHASGSGSGSTRSRSASTGSSGGCAYGRGSASGSASGCISGTRASGWAACGSITTGTRPTAADVAVRHDDDEGFHLASGNQIVHDKVGVSLTSPTSFVFPRRRVVSTEQGSV